MTWRERVEKGAFRGVEFFIESNELTSGRRTATHEFPKRDNPFIEDMGRATRNIVFDAYLIGPDYLIEKKALIAALEEEGPGELVHPFYGRRTVQAGSFTVRETRTEGGMARFSLTFRETEGPTYPSISVDTTDAVAAAAADSLQSCEASFLDEFSVAGLPQWAVDQASATVAAMSDAMAEAFAPVRASIETAAALNQDIIRLKDQAEDFVRQPERLANMTRSIMGSVASSSASASSRGRALSAFYSAFNPPAEPTTTPTRQRADDNRAALAAYARQTCVINESVVATQRRFETLSDAEAARDDISDRIDDQADTAPDSVFDSLTALRARLVRAIPQEDASLPRVVVIRERQTIPALVLAYRLYADAERASDIVTRNRIRHPSFVPGGVDIEVLSSD